MDSYRDRARGAIAGFVLGDAMCMPTQSMDSNEVVDAYGLISGLGSAADDHPLYPSAPAGSATARTEQMLILGRILSSDGDIDPQKLADELLSSDDVARSFGRRDVLDEQSRRALAAPRASGSFDGPASTGAEAAARAVPIGVAFSLARAEERLEETVFRACLPTHGTAQGIDGARLVAGTVSAGIDGAGVADAVDFALAAAAGAPSRFRPAAEASVITRTLQALEWADDLREVELVAHAQDVVGLSRSAGEAVPAAIVLAKAYARDPFRGLCVIAQLGGESCLIGSIAGSILGGALGLSAFPQDVLRRVDALAGDEVLGLADRFLAQSGRGTSIRGLPIA